MQPVPRPTHSSRGHASRRALLSRGRASRRGYKKRAAARLITSRSSTARRVATTMSSSSEELDVTSTEDVTRPSKPPSRPASPALSRHSVYERKPKGDPTKRINSRSRMTVPKRRAPMASASPKKPNKQFKAVNPREVAVNPKTVVRAHPSIEVTTSAGLLTQSKRVSRIPVKCVNPRPRPAASAAAPGQSAVDGPRPAVSQPSPVTLDIEGILLQTPEPIRTPPTSSPFLPSLSPTPPAPRPQASPRPVVTPPTFTSPINLVSPSIVILSPIASPSSTLRPQSLRGSPRRPMIIKVADAKLQTPAWMVESLIEEYLGKAPSKALPPWLVRKMELAACRSRARARLHQDEQQEEGRRRGQHSGRRPEPQRSHQSSRSQPRSGSRDQRRSKDQRR
ncbi:uncharacterized protein [Bemisia tabaci]|uniref:uncharacterized protein n=1 Tax=Bemisia tabaci TaxID=7038 RepID=UPI003B283D66